MKPAAATSFLMQKAAERFSSEVLDAASAPVRLQILKLLTSRGPLPYTEIMYESKLDPVRDAGKFVYHLKTLKKAGLVSVEKGTKKYGITELGKIIVEFTRDLDEYAAVRKGRMFVRTSRMTIEQFDRSRIAKSLATEAGMPSSLAEEVASEAEERLLRFGTTYLTAPLIRELVNTILVERKLEDYRHKLTRLGLPVNDVTMLLREGGEKRFDSGWVERSAGAAVTEEYVLLQSLSKSLADAHLSGRIHLEETGSWILKPSVFFHDPRPFFQHGLPGSQPPSSLEDALQTILRLVRTAEGEVSGDQVFSRFNILVAPFVKGIAEERVREAFRLFLSALNWNGFSNLLPASVTVGVNHQVPASLQSMQAVGPNGKADGVYGDFSREAGELFRIIIDSAREIASRVPLVNPAIIASVPKEYLLSGDSLVSSLQESSARFSTPNFFVNDAANASIISSEGCTLSIDGTGLSRGAVLGTVLLNLPRLAYEASGKDEKLFHNIHSATTEAIQAIEIHREAIRNRMKEGLLPLLSWQANGSAYYGPQPATAELALMGLYEGVKFHARSDLWEKGSISLVKKIVDAAKEAIAENEMQGLRINIGLHPSLDASWRLAAVDAEKFGFSTIVHQGSKKYPYYTDVPLIPIGQKVSMETRSILGGEIQKVFDTGSILPVSVRPGVGPLEIAKTTTQLVKNGVKYFAYGQRHYRCQQCYHSGLGFPSKCENCSSERLSFLARHSGRILPLEVWPEARRRDVEAITSYDVS